MEVLWSALVFQIGQRCFELFFLYQSNTQVVEVEVVTRCTTPAVSLPPLWGLLELLLWSSWFFPLRDRGCSNLQHCSMLLPLGMTSSSAALQALPSSSTSGFYVARVSWTPWGWTVSSRESHLGIGLRQHDLVDFLRYVALFVHVVEVEHHLKSMVHHVLEVEHHAKSMVHHVLEVEHHAKLMVHHVLEVEHHAKSMVHHVVEVEHHAKLMVHHWCMPVFFVDLFHILAE